MGEISSKYIAIICIYYKFNFSGVIDGTHVAITAPRRNDQLDYLYVRNGKNDHSINVQLVRDFPPKSLENKYNRLHIKIKNLIERCNRIMKMRVDSRQFYANFNPYNNNISFN